VRYAVIADIHANLHALEAVLSATEKADVDEYLVAGDLVGYGPFPNECVARVAELGASCVAGNHDLIALGALGDDRCIPLARTSLAWTRRVLGDAERAYLTALPRTINRSSIVVTHGSLSSPEEYTARRDQAMSQLEGLRSSHPDARLLVVGHTHRPWACDELGRVWRVGGEGSVPLGDVHVLVNPGAVGQSRELRVRARFGVVDTDGSMSFGAVNYDVDACRRALAERGLSTRAPHLRPSLMGSARRAARAVAYAAVPRRGPAR